MVGIQNSILVLDSSNGFKIHKSLKGTDPEVWDKPVFIREMKKDPRNLGSPPQAMITGYQFEQGYTRPLQRKTSRNYTQERILMLLVL